MANFKYKFLEEKPFITNGLKGEPKFGHKEIISSLKDIVQNCISPFTIGLFGKWGSGKSTIAENVQNDLKKDNIPVVIFDVWKHEGDALRRTFIQELVLQLQNPTKYGETFFPKDFKLDERLDKTEKSVIKGELVVDFKRFTPLLEKIWDIIGVILFVLGVGGILIFLYKNEFFNPYIRNILSGFTYIVSLISGGALLAWFAKNMSTFVTSNDITRSIDKFKDPHEFEKEFIRVLQALEHKRILIVFDNLDRVSGKNSVRIISTIKTFLEPIDKDLKEKEVVFLIPCDVDAIKSHLLKVFKDEIGDDSQSHTYSNEYLRKFFNTMLWIPEFYSIELTKFAHEKLKETEITDFNNDKLSWLITKAFKQNPRQIIQFINVLTANYILIQKRVQEDWLEEDFLKKNIAQLAKFLLLNQKFPLIVDYFRKSSTYDLREAPDDYTKNLHDYNLYDDFLEDTSDIFIESLEPFFTYRTSRQERKIKGISKLLTLMDVEKLEEATEYAEQLDLGTKTDEFSDIIMKQLGLISNPISAYRFLNILFNISEKLKLIFHKNAYTEIQNRFKDKYLDNIDQIDPNLLESELFIKFKELSNDKRKKISKKWIELLDGDVKKARNIKISDKYSLKTVKQLIKYPQHIYKVDHNKLQIAIADNYAGNIEVAKSIIEDKEKQDVFLSSEYTEKYIGLILNEDFTNNLFTEKAELLLKIDASIFTQSVSNSLITKATSLINTENAVAISDEGSIKIKNDLLGFVTDIYRVFKAKLFHGENPELDNGFVSAVVQGFNGLRWGHCSIYVPLLYEFKNNKSEPYFSQANTCITSFIQNAVPTDINNALFFLEEGQSFIEDSENLPIFNSRAIQTQDFFDTFYESISEENQILWLTNLLGGNHIDRFCATLKALNYKIPDKRGFANKVLTKTKESLLPTHKDQLFFLLDNLKLKKVEFNVDSLLSQIRSMLMQVDQNIQEVGLKVFLRTKHFTTTEKTQIALDSFSWMTSSNQFFQAHTINGVAKFYHKFAEETKIEFVDFLFEKFIVASNRPQFIKQGFELLYEIPTTTLSKQEEHFDKIKLKIEEYKNHPELKEAYVSGVRKLIGREKNYAKVRSIKNWLDSYD